MSCTVKQSLSTNENQCGRNRIEESPDFAIVYGLYRWSVYNSIISDIFLGFKATEALRP